MLAVEAAVWWSLLACVADEPAAGVPTEAAPPWKDARLAGCEVLEHHELAGGNSSYERTLTYDDAGNLASARFDGDVDGVPETEERHTWADGDATTACAALVPGVSYEGGGLHDFDGPRLVWWELDTRWEEGDLIVHASGAVETTWDGDLPARQVAFYPADGPVQSTTDWTWTEDHTAAVLATDDGSSEDREYDADLQLVARVWRAADPSVFEEREELTWGPLGPTSSQWDNDEDGRADATTTWTWRCP
jgi:hypothetical protein